MNSDLDHDGLLRIVDDWSLRDRPPEPSVWRSVWRSGATPAGLSDRVALVIQGVRRCGKSTLMRQLIARYGLDPARCAFVNFEDPRLVGRLGFETLQAIVDAFRARQPGPAPRVFLFDEIQQVEGWQRWLRAELDRPRGDRFVVSGSNAALLSGELGATLTGRHLTVELYPFDLEELRRARPETTVADYLHGGGFPEPVTRPDGDLLLRQYFNDIVERDLRERLGARSSRPLRQMVQMVLESAGSELSLRRVAAPLGVAVETAASYLEAAELAYLVFGAPFFAWSERKRASMPRKYYPIDTGLRRAVTTKLGADLGKALECATFLALRRRFGQVCYWRGPRGEVDFVVDDNGRTVPVQVSLDGLKPRHEAALTSFYEAFPQAAEARVVTLESFSEL